MNSELIQVLKILVIEANVAQREHILDLLKELGDFREIHAKDGERGVKLAKKHLPSLIFCAATLPNMTGFDVVKQLRQDPSTANIPSIVADSDNSQALEIGIQMAKARFENQPSSK
jgi:CheY-like chemotaxis protein